MKYYKNSRLYYKLNDDKAWWYYSGSKWVPSLTLWKKKYNKFVNKVSELEVLVVLGARAVK